MSDPLLGVFLQELVKKVVTLAVDAVSGAVKKPGTKRELEKVYAVLRTFVDAINQVTEALDTLGDAPNDRSQWKAAENELTNALEMIGDAIPALDKSLGRLAPSLVIYSEELHDNIVSVLGDERDFISIAGLAPDSVDPRTYRRELNRIKKHIKATQADLKTFITSTYEFKEFVE